MTSIFDTVENVAGRDAAHARVEAAIGAQLREICEFLGLGNQLNAQRKVALVIQFIPQPHTDRAAAESAVAALMQKHFPGTPHLIRWEGNSCERSGEFPAMAARGERGAR